MLFFVTTSSSSVCFTPDWTIIIVALLVVKVGYEAWVTILMLQKLQIFGTHTFLINLSSEPK